MHNETTPQYLRVADIVTTRKKGDAGVTTKLGILSVSQATWWAWCKAKKAPQPIKLSAGVTVWRRDDVIAFAESLANGSAQ